jgi:MFS family permease
LSVTAGLPTRAKLRREMRLTVATISTLIFTFLLYLLVGMLFATLPQFVQGDLGYGSVIAGSAISLQYVTTFISRPAAGRLADKMGPKYAVVLGLAVTAASAACLLGATLVTAHPPAALFVLGISRLLLGVAESFVGTGTLAWGVARLGAPNMARTISWNGMMSYGGMAVGAPTGVAIVSTYGAPALGVASLSICVAGFAIAVLRRPTKPTGGESLGFGDVFLRVLPYGAALALASTGFGSIAAFITLFYAARHWHGAEYALSSFGVCFAGLRFFLGGAIGRFGGLRVALGAMAVEAAALIVLSRAASPHMAAAAAAVTGMGFSPMFPALGVVAVSRVPVSSRGAAIGTYNLFADVAMVAVGPAAGYIADHQGYGAVYLAAAAAVATGAALVTLLLLAPGRLMNA